MHVRACFLPVAMWEYILKEGVVQIVTQVTYTCCMDNLVLYQVKGGIFWCPD